MTQMCANRISTKRLLFILFALLFAEGAYAQAVQQSGPVTPFHLGIWFQNAYLQDAGWTGAPYVSSLGLFNGTSCPFGISSQSGPGYPTGQYSMFSICQTNSLTTFNFQGLNGLGAPGLQFNFNGTIFPFPFSGGGSSSNVTVTPISSTGSTALSAFSQIVAVKTSSASAVTIVLPAASSFPTCPAATFSCPVITVKDVYGDSSTGQITVTTADSIHIDGPTSTYYLPFQQQSADFVLLGTSWMVK